MLTVHFFKHSNGFQINKLGTLSGTFMASLFITHENDTPLAKKILESVVTDQQRTEFLHAVS